MVLFNDPVPCPDPCLRAARMALEMREAISVMTADWHRRGYDLGFGVGISHGYATLGCIGFAGRTDYSAIGTVVNLAARLCSEADGGMMLTDGKVHSVIESMADTTPAGEVSLKGFSRPIAAFVLQGLRAAPAANID